MPAGLTLFFLLFMYSGAIAGGKSITLDELKPILAQKPQNGGYMLVDSRPEIKYFSSHLPWAVSIPFQDMEKMLDKLPADKDTKLIFYCGGVKCKLSDQAADLALAQNYTDVNVFAEGEPGWTKAGQIPWVATNYIKILLNDPEKIALLVDTRPEIKYNQGTLPGALNIPWPQFAKMKGLLPADTSARIVFFCGGLECDLSHKSAEAARKVGYTNVLIYAEGYPQWKKNSTRAFAMINPKNPAGAVAEAEEVTYPGEIKKDEFLKLVKIMAEGFMLVDVRPAEDFKAGHISGAINILDEEIGDNIDSLKTAKDIVFYCATGSRSAIAYYAAEDAGLKGTRFLNAEVNCKADGSFEVN
jgi:rhodanese-related sulfurtransferase